MTGKESPLRPVPLVRMLVPIVASLSVVAAACGPSMPTGTSGGGTNGSGASAPGGPVSPSTGSGGNAAPVESNPPGDLPDQVAWIHPPTAAGRFQIDVPEGWGRSQPSSNDYLYDDNAMYNSIEVGWMAASSAPTVSSAKSHDVPRLQRAFQSRAFQLENVSQVSLSAGPAVLIRFLVNSPPNPTTGKSLRDEQVRYELFRSGTEAVFALTSAVNQDTTDFYNHVKDSFRWV